MNIARSVSLWMKIIYQWIDEEVTWMNITRIHRWMDENHPSVERWGVYLDEYFRDPLVDGCK
jgi:hypothetical protein